MNTTSPTYRTSTARYVGRRLRFYMALCLVVSSFAMSHASETTRQNQKPDTFVSGLHTQTGSFQGSMQLNSYAVSAEGEEQLRSGYHILVHPGYLRLAGDQQGTFRLMGALSTDGVIVRQDQEQVVFLTRDQQALVMSHTELRQMLAMMDQLRGAAAVDTERPDAVVSKSGEHQVVQGYRSERWNAAVPGHSAEWRIWVTDELQVTWGMLAENWLLERVFPPDLPVAEWMRQGLVPLKAEMWNEGMLVQTVRFEQINPEPLSAAHFEVPEGYVSMTFQQLLFGQMRNRQ